MGSYFGVEIDLNRLVEKERSGEVATAPLQSGCRYERDSNGDHRGTQLHRGTGGGTGTDRWAAGDEGARADVRYGVRQLRRHDAARREVAGAGLPPHLCQRRERQDGVVEAHRRCSARRRGRASSAAVPGFLPAVEVDGGRYADAPRASFSADLVAEEQLDAVIYIGMPTPKLLNTVEEGAQRARGRRASGGSGCRWCRLRTTHPANHWTRRSGRRRSRLTFVTGLRQSTVLPGSSTPELGSLGLASRAPPPARRVMPHDQSWSPDRTHPRDGVTIVDPDTHADGTSGARRRIRGARVAPVASREVRHWCCDRPRS